MRLVEIVLNGALEALVEEIKNRVIEDLSPKTGTAAEATTAEAASEKRKRRTKAEMEAARAAEAQTPATTPTPQEPATQSVTVAPPATLHVEVVAPPPAPAPAPTPAPAQTAPAPTGKVDQARELLVKLSELPGSSVEAASTILAKYGKKLGAVEPGKLDGLIAELSAAIANHGKAPAATPSLGLFE